MSDPKTAEEAYLAIEVCDYEEDGPRHVEDYEGTWFVRGWNAALVESDLRRVAERVLAFADEAVSDDDGSVYWDHLDPRFTDLLGILRAALSSEAVPEEPGS